MFRNCEGYADPTQGLALSHIDYEERQEKKNASREKGPVKRKHYHRNGNEYHSQRGGRIHVNPRRAETEEAVGMLETDT